MLRACCPHLLQLRPWRCFTPWCPPSRRRRQRRPQQMFIHKGIRLQRVYPRNGARRWLQTFVRCRSVFWWSETEEKGG